MTIQQTTHDVLEAIRKSQSLRQTDPRQFLGALEKSTFQQPVSAISGLSFYDLEAGAKFLAPVLTPLRNETPRFPARAASRPTGAPSPASTPRACGSASPAATAPACRP